jgi:hypothetical protein
MGKPYASQSGKKLLIGVDDVNSHVPVACHPKTSTIMSLDAVTYNGLRITYWPSPPAPENVHLDGYSLVAKRNRGAQPEGTSKVVATSLHIKDRKKF